MSFMLLAALLIAPLIFGDAALVTNGYTKSKDFVDVLKQDLRRNNDDYLDAMQHKTSSTSSNKNFIELGRYDLKTLPAPTMNRLNFRGDDKRRALNELESEDSQKVQELAKQTERILLNFTIPKVVVENKTTSKMSTPAKVTKVTLNRPSFRSENKHVNKEKMERFKKLISKNKDTFNEYLNKKLKTHAKKTVSPRKKTHTPLKYEPTLRADTLMSVNDKETTRFKSGTEEPVMVVSTITPGEGSLNEDFGARLRARDEKSNKEPVVPRADDLDMSPAKGRKVHVMRLKGRLCQRNVMLPEGPKYDSQGRMYLGAYVNKYDRDYSNTKRPRLLLPRCCNCCKKSVLGCE